MKTAKMNGAAALLEAEAEGLTLLRSESSESGYKGVAFISGKNLTMPYKARVQRGGKTVTLGSFATAEEAALCYARTPEAQAAAAAPPKSPPMTAEEAVRQAEAEGLTLRRAEGSLTGFKMVSLSNVAARRQGLPVSQTDCKGRPYQAAVCRGGKNVHLGTFATAEEAALCVARTPEGRRLAAVPPAPPPMTAEEAVRQAEAEGLTLLKAERSDNCTGYKGVGFKWYKGVVKGYQAYLKRDGKQVTLGFFETAEEAALAVARTPEAQATAAESTPMTAEDAVRQAEAEGLTLLRSTSCSSGYTHVSFQGEASPNAMPYRAQIWRGNTKLNLGYGMTAEEAALVVARHLAAEAAAPEPPATSSRKRKASSEDSEEQPPDVPADVVVTLDGQFVEAKRRLDELEERFEALERLKRFLTEEEYAAKKAELMKEI